MPHYVFPKGMPGKETAPLTEAKQEGPRRPSPHEGDPKVQKGGGTCGKAAQRASGRAKEKAGSPGPAQGLTPGHPAVFPITVCAVSSRCLPCPPNNQV